ncbi:MAG: radical SAM protein [Oligoflexia bacterium]|nr:radical SAM protein [Oligoflexia bacterium]
MNVLLINPYCTVFASAGHFKDFLVPMPPIALAYLAAYLEKENISVGIHDDFLHQGDNEKIIKLITENYPAVIGIPTFSASLMYRVFEIVAIIRKYSPNTLVVLGNIHANIFDQDLLLKQQADVIVYGEGEITFAELVQAQLHSNGCRGHQYWKDIRGISYLDNGQFIKNPARPFIENLDVLPFPAWHLLPIFEYDTFNFAKIQMPALLISGSRGCNFKCSFCSLIVSGNHRRVRSAKSIVDEMEFFHKRYGIRQFSFVDPMFPGSLEEAVQFSSEIIARDLHKKVIWITEIRVDLVSRQLIIPLKNAGLRLLMLGIETINDKSNQQLKKNITNINTFKAIQICKKEGVATTGFFILGIPGESKSDIFRTIKSACMGKLNYAKFNIFCPYPGTFAYKKLLQDKQLKIELIDNWNCYTSFPNRKYPPVYKYNNTDIDENKLFKYQYIGTILFYLRPDRMLTLILKFDRHDWLILFRHFKNNFVSLFK